MISRGRCLRVVVAFASLASVLGCKQILGLHERTAIEPADAGSDAAGPTPVVGECGGLRHASASCAACMDRSCCGEATACRNDVACDPSFDCLTGCGSDSACRGQCALFYTQPDALVRITSCRETNCAQECGLSCGGFGNRVPGCDSCVRATCCALGAACAKNEQCVKLDICRTSCVAGSMTCPPQCDRDYPGGVADYAPWSDCTQKDCAASCQAGRVWECLDSAIRWPRPKGNVTEVTFSLNVVDILSEKPFAAAKVKACGKLDQHCDNPLDEDTTDAAGMVSLTVPVSNVGFDGYVDISGGDSGGGTPIYPSLWYPVPYIVSSGSRGNVQFVSQSSFDLLAGITGVTADPARGHFAANAQDCTFSTADGVSFTADMADIYSRTYYFVNGIPNTSATSTDPQSGIGGFVNLPARLTLVTATTSDGKKITGPNYFIRAGTMTVTSLPPTN
jgi:hypothetical protein